MHSGRSELAKDIGMQMMFIADAINLNWSKIIIRKRKNNDQ